MNLDLKVKHPSIKISKLICFDIEDILIKKEEYTKKNIKNLFIKNEEAIIFITEKYEDCSVKYCLEKIILVD